MTFKNVAEIFEKIEAISGRLEITKILASLFDQLTAQEAKIIANICLGQLEPPYIGTQFNMAEKTIIKAVAEFVGTDDETIRAAAKKQGDIGLVIGDYEWKPPTSLTIEEVYEKLVNLEHLSGRGSHEAKINALKEIYEHLDPISAKHITRVIIGRNRLGFSDMTIVDALSWMLVGDKSQRAIIEHAYNVCADIGLIAYIAKTKGITGLKNQEIEIGIPIMPAAAERLPSAQAIIEKIGNCVAQPKVDGFRLQIHVDTTKRKHLLKFYSRNLQDMSAMFPDLVDELSQLPVDTAIIEGEAIAFEPNTETFLRFQETVKRKRKHEVEKAMQELPIKLFLFDILYLNGESLLNEPHEKRRALLFKSVPKKGLKLVEVIEEKEITSAEQLDEYFQQMISQGLEGLVVKRPDANYQPGKRNFNWIKLKRREEGHLEDTIDCVVLGYYGGRGRRTASGIGAFLIGVYNKKQDQFETVAKIGTGLSDAGWIELKKLCDQNISKTQPTNIVCAKQLEPDVWTYPTIVVQVRADEITKSPLHTAGKTKDKPGYALRFPRFMGYRPEKNPTDATSIDEIVRLHKDQFIK